MRKTRTKKKQTMEKDIQQQSKCCWGLFDSNEEFMTFD